ncbi:ATP-binding protein [Heyndrickxia coagulans]|uniref:ATP-binding protein n=1 Tax=Heyndrickxia coagulans TaxID=1398 RepID=UPI001F41F682|nr:ATP-binding protein [Heyndrickxia coagulans]UJZ88290.1 ATP-binding protein [Heyndrickxia coagulans]
MGVGKIHYEFMDLPLRFHLFSAVVGMDGILKSISSDMQTVTGFDAGDWVGRPFSALMHHDDRNKWAGILNGEEEEMGLFMYRMKSKNGDYKWVESTYVVFKDLKYGEKPHIHLLTKDMTVVKELYDYLVSSEQLSMVGQLAAGIAHEIRNPLTAIKGFLQLMQAGVIDTGHYLDIMQNEIERIEMISSELLFLGRPKASDMKVCCLQTLLDEVLVLMETQSYGKNIQIETVFPSQPIFICCDDSKMKQVFVNLIKNGLEAMEEGGTLTVELSVAGERAAVAIRDEGIGIPPEKLEKIGQPFYTTKERGNGLGLMVCYQIVREHNGDISIESKPGEGTVFTVVLPWAGPDGEQEASGSF